MSGTRSLEMAESAWNAKEVPAEVVWSALDRQNQNETHNKETDVS